MAIGDYCIAQSGFRYFEICNKINKNIEKFQTFFKKITKALT